MKKILVVALVVAIALVGASSAFALVAGTKHDLSSTGGNTFYHVAAGGLSSCQYCHTPHGANTAMTAAPIWNRAAGAAPTLYGTTVGGTAMSASLGAISQACLSCHDGSLSVVNTFANGNYSAGNAATPNVTAGGIMSGLPLIGPDLSNDHPVGFVVVPNPPALAGLKTLAQMQAFGFKFFTVANNNMECGTCHDPHDNTNSPFLRSAKATICTDCHNAK